MNKQVWAVVEATDHEPELWHEFFSLEQARKYFDECVKYRSPSSQFILVEILDE